VGRDKDTLGKLRALADRADQVAGALELFDLDFDFYVAVSHLSGNQVMLLLINTVRDGVRGFMPLLANLAAPGDVVRKHHRDLIAAFEKGDVNGAGRIADEYLRMAPSSRRGSAASRSCSRYRCPASRRADLPCCADA